MFGARGHHEQCVVSNPPWFWGKVNFFLLKL